MKYIITELAIYILLTSCETSKRTDNPEANIMRDSIASFDPLFHGVWVKSDYVNKILKTKSPYKSSDKLNGIVTLIIDTQKQTQDSLPVGSSLNNHEGYGFIVFQVEGHAPTSLTTDIVDYETESNFYELDYTKNDRDTSSDAY